MDDGWWIVMDETSIKLNGCIKWIPTPYDTLRHIHFGWGQVQNGRAGRAGSKWGGQAPHQARFVFGPAQFKKKMFFLSEPSSSRKKCFFCRTRAVSKCSREHVCRTRAVSKCSRKLFFRTRARSKCSREHFGRGVNAGVRKILDGGRL